jgi:hypothetical protein
VAHPALERLESETFNRLIQSRQKANRSFWISRMKVFEISIRV